MRYPLALAGWDAMSTWGWDDQAQTWFAELTRNESDDSDGPDVWLAGPIGDEPALAHRIAQATGRPLAEVEAAMRDGRRYAAA